MPLHVFNRDANGTILKDPETQEEQMVNLPLDGEMADFDFEVPHTEFKNFGFEHGWLRANFDQNTLWVPEAPDFDAYKRDLADFLYEYISGPYYVHEGYINTRWTLALTFLKQSDIETFAAAYPDWEADANAVSENAATLAVWKEKGRTLQDPSLYDYAASPPPEMGATATPPSNPAPG